MKKVIYLILVISLICGCEKEESTPTTTTTANPTPTTNGCNDFSTNIVGTWNIGAHEYNTGGSWINCEPTGTMTFLSDGTYTHSSFTYAWHCSPGADEADSGEWNYDVNTNKLTLVSTKSQTDSQGWNHKNSTISPIILSCMTNKVIFQYSGPICTNQTIKITLIR